MQPLRTDAYAAIMNALRRALTLGNAAAMRAVFPSRADLSAFIRTLDARSAMPATRLAHIAALVLILGATSSAFAYISWRERSREMYALAASVVPGNRIVYLADEAMKVSMANHVVAEEVPSPMREVHIANTGSVLMRGATVRSVSDTALFVSVIWGASEYAWRLETDGHTRFLDQKGEKVNIHHFQVGDIVTATGVLVAGGAEGAIETEYVQMRKKYRRD